MGAGEVPAIEFIEWPGFVPDKRDTLSLASYGADLRQLAFFTSDTEPQRSALANVLVAHEMATNRLFFENNRDADMDEEEAGCQGWNDRLHIESVVC